jgi:branched-chain amino acid transport system substrate-binding protein
VNQKWNYYNVKETIPADETFQPLATSKCRLVVN